MSYLDIIQSKPDCKIVVLTGAGISAESGIKTFRDGNGLWENHPVEDVATPEGFNANPELVYRFYNERRAQLLSKEVTPNAAHYALSKLETRISDNFWIVTQNVDNLHERAGSKNVIHMHGELTSAKCPATDNAQNWVGDLNQEHICDCCEVANSLRPDIVWFGEVPYKMQKIETLLFNADLFVSIGTSGNVYPAAGFVNFANQCSAYTLELNLEPSVGETQFAESKQGPASVLIPEFVNTCLSSMN